MDKSYMLGHSYGKTGLFHHWSPIADYSTPEMVKVSDKLPVPNGKLLSLTGEVGKIAVTYEAEGTSKLSQLVYNYLHIDSTLSREEKQLQALTYIKDILVEFNKQGKFDISSNLKEEKYLYNLIYLLNKHNSHIVSDNEAKNLAVDSIISVCQDIRNVQSAHSPIDVATSKLKSFLKELEVGSIGDEYDGISIFQLQEDNQTGKKVVGVMANALKAFLTITQYYNNYYASNPQNIGKDNKYFLNKITIEGVDYYMSKVANTTTEEYQLKVLANILKQTIGEEGIKLLDTKDDVSIILSAMVTLATDNAKELALAKLHASLNLASMHTYLLSMGIPFDVVVKYTASSQLFKDLYELTNANSWENKKGTLDKNVWKALSNKAKSGNSGYTQADIEQLRNLHQWAQEFRSLTQLLGINSGMKNGVDKALLFKYQFQKIISKQASALKIDRSLNYLQEEDIDQIIKLHGFNPTEELRQTYINKIENLKTKYENEFPELFNEGLGFIEVEIDKYFTDIMYRDAITDIYDLIKSTINVLDVINESPHFYAMLEALNTVLRRVAKGAKGDLLFNKLQSLFDNTQALENNIQVPLFIDSMIIKDAQSFCDDYFVSHFLTNYVTPNYSFRYTSKTSNVDITKSISFDSEEALKDFDYTFRTIIARLKNKFPNNQLLKSLIQYERKDERKVFKLNFNIDMLSKDQAGEQQLKYNEIIGGFDEIVDLPISTLLEEYACTNIDPNTNQMRQITVGDLFYLYNLIYNLGQRGQNSLTAILDRYVSSKKDLVVNYLQTVLDFDTLKNEMLVNKQKFNYHIFKRYLRTGSKIRLYNMNPSLQILTNLGQSKKSETLTGMYQRFISALLSGKLKIEMDLNCN